MVTNLVHYPAELAELVRRYHIHVTASLDGPPEINDMQRVHPDGRGTYQAVAANIRRLRAATCEPSMIESTFTRRHVALGWTAAALRRFFLNAFGVRMVLIAPVGDPQDSDAAFRLLPQLCEGASWLAPGIAEEGAVDPGELVHMVPIILQQRSPYWCGAGMSALSVTPKGDVYPCHLFLGHPEYRIGNVLSGEWNESVVDQLRGNSKPNDPTCRECNVDWACTGCVGGVLTARGVLSPRHPRFCAAVRENAERTLQQCVQLATGSAESRRLAKQVLEECLARE